MGEKEKCSWRSWNFFLPELKHTNCHGNNVSSLALFLTNGHRKYLQVFTLMSTCILQNRLELLQVEYRTSKILVQTQQLWFVLWAYNLPNGRMLSMILISSIKICGLKQQNKVAISKNSITMLTVQVFSCKLANLLGDMFIGCHDKWMWENIH